MKAALTIHLRDGLRLKDQFDEAILSEVADIDEPMAKSRAIIRVCEHFLDSLRREVVQTGFSTKKEEVTFFKEIKPFITGQLYYNSEKYYIMMRRPAGSRSVQEQFLQQESLSVQQFCNSHAAIYQYYRAKATDFDNDFFLRDAVLQRRDFQFPPIEDRIFSTGYDILFARIICSELLLNFLQQESELLNNPQQSNGKRLVWQASKTAAVELAYALKKMRVFGDASLQDIVDNIEQAWTISLGNYSRTHQQTKFRKSGSSTFPEELARHYKNSLDF